MAAIEEAENAWRTALGDRLHLPCRDALHAHCRRRTRPRENGFAGTGREMGPLGDPQSIRWLLS